MTKECHPRHNLEKLGQTTDQYCLSLQKTIEKLNYELNRMDNNLSPNPCLLEEILPPLMMSLRRCREIDLIVRKIKMSDDPYDNEMEP